jgi:RimJ/RimL family protein N-acetyltransferase
MDDYIYHYGTKRHSGRYPWGSGQRPYQGEKNYETYSTDDINKHKKHNDRVNDIYSTFTDKEKYYVEGEPGDDYVPEKYYFDKYYNEYPYNQRLYSNIVQIKDVPVGYIEFWNNSDNRRNDIQPINVSIGVRNDEKYRNAGIASRMYKRGEQAVKDLKDKGFLDQNVQYVLEWYAINDNYKSIAAAIKNGFEDKGDTENGFRALEKTI